MDTTEPQDHVVIVAGGDIGSTIEVPHGASVIAADSGWEHRPDLLQKSGKALASPDSGTRLTNGRTRR